jgi:hypothetical protein
MKTMTRKRQNTDFLTGAFAGAGILLLTGMLLGGCGQNQNHSGGSFRVRSAFEASLITDEGWAGKINEPVTIQADQPFRLRFEVEPSAALERQTLSLQYRRNAGAWTPVEAHDFPYPARERDLDFEDTGPGETPVGWSIEGSGSGNMTVGTEGGEKVLRSRAGEDPLLIMHTPPWEVTELAAEIKLSTESPSGAGFIFAYTDPQNYCRVFLDDNEGVIRVSRITEGGNATLAEQAAVIPAGQWVSLEIDLENQRAEINFENDTLEFEVEEGTPTPSSQIGFFLPAGGVADFRDIAIAGEARTPRVSIVSCPGFENGEATTDLLNGAKTPFTPGGGMASAEQTPPWTGGEAHTEYEWALVVRRFADTAVTNKAGDTFEFRMVSEDGQPLTSGPNPTLGLTIPAGHLGGTFVEAPGKLGPWQAANGDLYFVMEPTETDNLFMMVKSNDHGKTWQEVDAANRPETNDLEAVEGRQIGDTIYILHQVTEATVLHAFRTSDHLTNPNTWAFTDELAAVADSMAQANSLVVRSDGSMVAFYVGQTLHYNVRSTAGAWGEQIIVDPDAPAAAGPKAVVGADDTVHVAYYRVDGTLWHRSLLKNGILTSARELASGAGTSRAEYGAVLTPVYMPVTGTVAILYRLDDGYLWERRIDKSGTMTSPVRVSDRTVVTDAVDSQQAGADVVLDGQTLHVLFIDEETRSIWHTRDRGGWQPATLQVDNILGSWVRGNIITNADGKNVYGIVYDAGSYGGAGMNRYAEVDHTGL